MKSLLIDFVPDSPYYPAINFDATSGICELSGESYMEEAYKFYMPLLDWIRAFTTNEQKPITVNFKLSYFNTSSSRLILDILELVKRYKDSGGIVTINWFYDLEDPDVKEEVEDFEFESGMDINLLPMK